MKANLGRHNYSNFICLFESGNCGSVSTFQDKSKAAPLKAKMWCFARFITIRTILRT